MKIILFYTYNRSFLSSFFIELAQQLCARGYDVKIVSLKNQVEIIEVPGLDIRVLKKRNKWLNYISIFKVIKLEKPDVIISNFSYVNPAILSGKILGVKKNIVWFHTLTQQMNPRRSQLFIKSIFLKEASEIIVNSEYLKGDLEQNYSIPKVKVFAIPFWSSLEHSIKNKLLRGNSLFKIGCPGRIEDVKNQQIIVDALKDLKLKSNWHFYIAGSGSGENSLKIKIAANHLNDKVDFLGVLSIDKMEDYYSEMDVIILPSKFEAFGLVLIEALSMGCPVLVSNKFGALTYIKDSEFIRKYTFDPLDPIDLKSKIEMIASETNSSEYFKNIYASYFQKDHIVAKVEEVIKL